MTSVPEKIKGNGVKSIFQAAKREVFLLVFGSAATVIGLGLAAVAINSNHPITAVAASLCSFSNFVVARAAGLRIKRKPTNISSPML